MVIHGEKSTKATRLQAGSSEADSPLFASINMRVAQSIGQQLASIGDQLDEEMGGSQRPTWFRPLLEVALLQLPGRGTIRRVPAVNHWELNSVYRVIREHLTQPVCVRAIDGWRTWVSLVQPSRPNWAAGLLAFTLLVTAAILFYR